MYKKTSTGWMDGWMTNHDCKDRGRTTRTLEGSSSICSSLSSGPMGNGPATPADGSSGVLPSFMVQRIQGRNILTNQNHFCSVSHSDRQIDWRRDGSKDGYIDGDGGGGKGNALDRVTVDGIKLEVSSMEETVQNSSLGPSSCFRLCCTCESQTDGWTDESRPSFVH